MINIIQKAKLRADEYISGFLIFTYFAFAIFFRLEALLLLFVYPFVALFFYGIIKIITGFSKRSREDGNDLNRVLLGIISIFFSLALLFFIISQPNITIQHLVNIAAFPLIVVGIAGIIKGRFISIYSTKWRVINIGIGIISVGFSLAALVSSYSISFELTLFHIISLSILILINIVSRAALYLSEYSLSLIHLRNFRIFFYIISDYFIFVNHEGNIVLEKIK